MRALPDAFRPRAQRPAIIGHRGVRGSLPENTLAAFEEAARQGADAVELDVRLAASGEVIVLHDPDLVRVAGDPARASELAFRDLSRIDLGGGERVPRLADVLGWAARAHVGVNVEIKHDVPSRVDVARAVARELARFPSVDVVVSSFDPWILALHRALRPDRTHAELVHESTYHDFALRLARGLRFDGVHLERSLATRARLAPFVDGRFAAIWTVNDPVDARTLALRGVSALITDTPARLAAALTD